MLRLYVDVAAVAASEEGLRLEKCLELMNVCAEADLLTALSVQDGKAQYLLLDRKSPYQALVDSFPMYSQLGELASNENNHVILTPCSEKTQLESASGGFLLCLAMHRGKGMKWMKLWFLPFQVLIYYSPGIHPRHLPLSYLARSPCKGHFGA